MSRQGYAWRPATGDDLVFERRLFEAAWPDALVLAAWPEAARTGFLDQQFNFQSLHYARAYPDADRLIVRRGGSLIGRVILDRAPHEWCVVDIALMPDWRGKGIGTQLLQGVLTHAADAAACVRLSVKAHTPARRLYERIGFAVELAEGDAEGRVGDVAHLDMMWRPAGVQLKTA